ncbi:glycerophosphodiester phosphodiesterase [Ochrovirga pacifica]|uniref:glycerophosphodiester phosphodiesterase n=1 Tax=Ochrovirga pacifica TaxID=1042376 RepID=UPI00025583B9|nr:glycerophosphodiester phosphodiesterase family protein [Ochrovirga pacifica]
MIKIVFSSNGVSRFCTLFLLLIIVACNKVNHTKVIAHRGAWKQENLPENSIASLKKAIALKCYGAEFDVHLTKDSIPVVNHDADFMGMEIEHSTYEQLLTKTLANGEQIPTLEAYLKEGLKQTDTKLILEIKSAPSGKERTLLLTKIAVAMVDNLQGKDMVAYICFDFDAGKLVHQLDSSAEVAYLNGDKTPKEALAAGYTGINYNYKVYKKHPRWILEAQDLGMSVNSWTVNKKEEMEILLHQNIDFITTNEPELLLTLLKKNT